MRFEKVKRLFEPEEQKMNLYTCNEIKKLISEYLEKDGQTLTIEEGILGYGTMVLFGKGLKTAIIQEVALNEWSSAHKIRMYNKCPKKYEKMIQICFEAV